MSLERSKRITMTERAMVVGIFSDRAQAERAIDALQHAGFTDELIGFVRRSEATSSSEPRLEVGSEATTGVIGGGVVGGVLGATASLLIPGLGPAIAGGILAVTLGGVAVGAAAGGIIGALIDMGVPEEEAHYYQSEFEAGHTVVTVRAANRQLEAIDLLHQYGAYNATISAGTAHPSGTPGGCGAKNLGETRWACSPPAC